jgi:hypothetical protein
MIAAIDKEMAPLRQGNADEHAEVIALRARVRNLEQALSRNIDITAPLLRARARADATSIGTRAVKEPRAAAAAAVEAPVEAPVKAPEEAPLLPVAADATIRGRIDASALSAPPFETKAHAPTLALLPRRSGSGDASPESAAASDPVAEWDAPGAAVAAVVRAASRRGEAEAPVDLIAEEGRSLGDASPGGAGYEYDYYR